MFLLILHERENILSGKNVLPTVFIKIEGCKKTFEYHHLCKKVIPLVLLMSDNFPRTLSIIETSAFYLHFGWLLSYQCLESLKEMFSVFASAPSAWQQVDCPESQTFFVLFFGCPSAKIVGWINALACGSLCQGLGSEFPKDVTLCIISSASLRCSNRVAKVSLFTLNQAAAR